MHDHAMEVDRTAAHTQLHRPKFAVPHAHLHHIVIAMTVDMPVPQVNPFAALVVTITILTINRGA